ncbi:8427_t:CDS:2 [Dentiscutata erythropus]|uniref:8427_t:CDS:1 n=1 Tax=Dentiscutata erythropus TaxID=1348616 RepID=A0A9N9BE68_9GLOM|nr:8427_t:CDS:2 [Dentiscutata erythropus]
MATCYYTQKVNSGNQDIDNLIKATHNNMFRFRLEWVPFCDFMDIKRIGIGGFSEVYTATWTKGIAKGWSRRRKEFCRIQNATVVLKVLKDSSTINSAFLKELQIIIKCHPNSDNHNNRLIQCYGVSKDPITNNYVFIMSYMSHGSLSEYLSNNFKNITWQMKLQFLRDIEINDLNTSIDLPDSKKHCIEFLLDNKSETKRRKLFNNGMYCIESDANITGLCTSSYQTIEREIPNSRLHVLSVSKALYQISTLGHLYKRQEKL